VHGANRLASNSLLECLVFGRRAALAALDEPALPGRLREDGARFALPVGPEQREVTDELREQVWRQAGVIRDPSDMDELARSPDPVASLVARFALARTESRGVHYRTDAPVADPALEGHFVLKSGGELKLEHWT
jgi:L-aspartate oxidase